MALFLSSGESDMNIVVGSGPSGLAVTMALLARGRKVTMIDGGETRDPATYARQAAMAATPPDGWSSKQIDEWQAPQFASEPGIVRRYGSDHAQIPRKQILEGSTDWFAASASHAVGGLSNVWGAAILPNRQEDIAKWPISIEDLKPHYKSVADFMPMAGRTDRLERLFPAVSMSSHSPLRAGPQGRRLLSRFDEVGDMLASEGVHVGQARQAVAQECNYCGMCLHGCPWDQIFSANHRLERLNTNPDFTYLPKHLASGFSQTGDQVQLHLKDGSDLSAKRLYLAAGVLETARIVLASQPEPGKSLKLKDSQHFFLPFLHQWKPDGAPESDPHHTLTEAFVEIDDKDISPFLIHSQIYGWNEFYLREMMQNYGRRLPGSKSLFRALSRRLMVTQTFLHSDHCGEISLSLGGDAEHLTALQLNNPDTERVMNIARKKLAKSLKRVGLRALTFASHAGLPGSSYHSGGTLPMSATPTTLQTDIAGRIHGLERVHVVDASVLPSIPATTITLSVMANAHRIGSLT